MYIWKISRNLKVHCKNKCVGKKADLWFSCVSNGKIKDNI